MTSFFPPQGGSSAPPDSFVTAPDAFYASPSGSIGGDGSQFSPFLYISQAVAAAESGVGGTVYYAANTQCSPTSGAGLWLRGTYDSGAGGAGWMACTKSIQFQPWTVQGGQLAFGGSGWAPGGGAGAFSNSPLWVSGVSQGTTFNNVSVSTLNGAFPAFRLGLSSPLNAYSAGTTYALNDLVVSGSIAYISLSNGNVGHTPVSSPTFWTGIRVAIADGLAPSLTSMVQFNNAYFEAYGVDIGPTIDIGGGFWYFFNQTVVARGSQGSDLRKNCAVRAYDDGAFGYTYDTYFENSRFNGMGVYCEGAHIIDMTNVTAENMEVMSVWHGEAQAVSGSPECTLINVDMADSGIVYCARNNGSTQCHAIDCDPVAGNFYVDRKIQVTSPAAMGQSGRVGPSMEVYHDGGRRLHAPGTLAYPNIATALQWFAGSYVTGPDGAASGTHTAKTTSVDYIIYDEGNGWNAPGDGDYYAWGLWIKWLDTPPTDQGFYVQNTGTGNITVFMGGPSITGTPGNHTLGASGFTSWLGGVPGEIGRWTWYAGWIKIIGTPGASTNLHIQASPSNAGHVSIAQPWLIHVPAADGLSDGEVAALAMQGFSSPNNGENTTAFTAAPPAPTVGMPAMQPGAKLAFWDATLHAWKYITVDNGALVIS